MVNKAVAIRYACLCHDVGASEWDQVAMKLTGHTLHCPSGARNTPTLADLVNARLTEMAARLEAVPKPFSLDPTEEERRLLADLYTLLTLRKEHMDFSGSVSLSFSRVVADRLIAFTSRYAPPVVPAAMSVPDAVPEQPYPGPPFPQPTFVASPITVTGDRLMVRAKPWHYLEARLAVQQMRKAEAAFSWSGL